jgi:hypothetical protein
MAVYMRGRTRRWLPAAVGAIGLVLGGGVGYAVGHSGTVTTADVLASARDKGEDASDALQRLPIEYEQALTNRAGESSTTMLEALDAAGSLLSDAFAAAPWLGPAQRQPCDAAIEALRGDVRTAASAETFEQHVDEAVAAIDSTFGVGAGR